MYLQGAVSIHASSREDATRFLRLKCLIGMFQSTRPRGRTRPPWKTPYQLWQVSIHASSREDATVFQLYVACGNKFQSTRPRGRTRPLASQLSAFAWLFQSTRTRGRTRLSCTPMRLKSAGFNPRFLAGGRDVATLAGVANIQFQSTRPRGRTRLTF